MKSIFFSLSLLLLLEKKAAGIELYAGGTKGHFLVRTSPLMFIGKSQFLYGHKEQEEAPEESIFVQTKHHAYGQDADADMGEALSSQELTSLKEDIVCDEEDELAQQKSQLQSQSQIKSQTQVKPYAAPLKSQPGQLKTIGQVKSQTMLKSQGAPPKSYKARLNLREDIPQQIKGRGYGLAEDLTQVRQQPAKVHRLKRKHSQSRKAAAFYPQFRHRSRPYPRYFVQFQEQLQGSVHHTKSFYPGPGMCYCPRGGVILYQDAFTG
ncbi:seminal vesicle secretory protein 3A isoform X1 [Mus caroli]|uniref:Seminal vesicle secretory protein 3A isoform X1 n=1 Tax=Mus caroli TaxID=10089 RepID=A0A6P5P8A6_MUSCR|nr:seminal vesicle secretory protein 3A isoform X1 [Mus caroli]XP_021008905.1 seminal vesicle secretory protein 3A isoform X1 [Mus caroli]